MCDFFIVFFVIAVSRRVLRFLRLEFRAAETKSRTPSHYQYNTFFWIFCIFAPESFQNHAPKSNHYSVGISTRIALIFLKSFL